MTQQQGAKVRVSHKKSATLIPGAAYPGLTVKRLDSKLIQLYTIDDFMSGQECETLIALVGDNFRLSTLAQYHTDLSFRTSETCDLGWIKHPFVATVEEKIARCMGIRLPYSQNTEAQKYVAGQEFKAHNDAYTPGGSAATDHKIASEGQRTWTFMVYLTDTEKGGGTRFPKLDHTFYPKRGRALVWNNLHKDGSLNVNALHQGMPVEAGQKIIITKWFVDKGTGRAWY